MKKYTIILILLFILTSLTINAQIIKLTPTGAGPEDAASIVFDATQGNGALAGANKVYAHHGVVTDGPNGTSWQYVIGNWGKDDGIGLMKKLDGETDKWELTFEPGIREYFGVPEGENIFRIALVFRSTDGSIKGTTEPGDYGWGTVASNLDIFVDLNVNQYIEMTSPLGNHTFLQSDESINLSAVTSAQANNISLWLDEGSGFSEVHSVSDTKEITYVYTPTQSTVLQIKFTADIGGEDLEAIKTYNITLIKETLTEAIPAGLLPGINYYETDDTKVSLVLEAPEKEFAYVVGDFTNWTAMDEYQMKQTPDGELFWLEVSGLTAEQEYVFQYWVEEDVKTGDPYADKIADPWNDGFIEPETYPDLPVYDKTEYGMASILQTGQTSYEWDISENDWIRPDLNHLVIYELLIRDFSGKHSFAELKDTLSYFKNLGIDAIEIMPFNEFEGNESWGYNPAYFFAPDKYYGQKEDVKQFVEAAHQAGLAVIMDMVLNHAYGQNPMVQLYFDKQANKPASNNPWFNKEYVGPYQWGYDFNHESPYTQNFIDRVNKYWLEEYHIDGYRFDFTKGFTNYAPGGNIDGFDQSRIDILERMADAIWETDPEAYIILEHWGPQAEEQQLAAYGMKMWRNRSYDYVPAMTGQNTGTLNGMAITSHVSYFNSHDERRICEHALTEGLNNGVYDVKNPLVMMERAKMIAAFTYLFPGPKMIWQFDELAYDIDIDYNGRVGNKPLPWGANGLGYYEDPLRKYVYQAYQGILALRKQIGPEQLATATTQHKLTGNTRRLVYDTEVTDLVLIGNFGLQSENINPYFTETGTWFDYFSGDEISINNLNEPITLKAGEWHIYTNAKLSEGMSGVVEIYDNPVSISPYPFNKNNSITITFDAKKAFPNGTAGLTDAEKVYIHSGVVLSHPDSSNLSNIVGTLTDDGLGLMEHIGNDVWQITIKPKNYYGLSNEMEVYKIGMYFRDADNSNQGMGFRNSIIYFKVQSDIPIVQIDPPAFFAQEEITIIFNARSGNQELIGADKVYMHSSVDLNDTQTPYNTAWQYTVGNWGQDDGIGEMKKVAGKEDMWEITLIPKTYYNLNNQVHPYWLACVFRNADGSKKGTGTPGPITNGFIHDNLDFFILNNQIIGIAESDISQQVNLYPNPVKDYVYVSYPLLNQTYVQCSVYDINGLKLNTGLWQISKHRDYSVLNLSSLDKGLYFVELKGEDFVIRKKVLRF